MAAAVVTEQLHPRIARYLFKHYDAVVPSSIASSTVLRPTRSDRCEEERQRNLHILHVSIASAPRLPHDDSPTTPSWQRDLFSRCIPYVARAFGEDLAEMTQESSEEHFRHLTGGDDLFAVVVEEADGTLRAAGHALFVSHPIVELYDSPRVATSVHCEGMCVDPDIHGAGIGGRLLGTAIRAYLDMPSNATQSLYVTARTQNDAILKIFYHAANSVLPPPDEQPAQTTDVASTLLIGPARVFPVYQTTDDATDTAHQQQLQHIAAVQAQITAPSSTYDKVTGVFPCCYPPHMRVIFGGNPEFATKSSGIPLHTSLRSYMRAAEDGDAAMLTVRVR